MHRCIPALLAALLGLALALPAEAQWKWRDSKGQTQYSDLPPPAGVPEQDILARTNDKGEREVLDDQARADETKRTREIIAANCSQP